MMFQMLYRSLVFQRSLAVVADLQVDTGSTQSTLKSSSLTIRFVLFEDRRECRKQGVLPAGAVLTGMEYR